jgi:hypothetical protein
MDRAELHAAADLAWDGVLNYASPDPDTEGVLAAIAKEAAAAFGKNQNKLAWALYRRIVRILERTLGPRHLDTIAARRMLGMTLRRLGRPHEAEPLIREALEAFRKQRGKDDFDTIVFTVT